jgi:hypothetical protein
VLNKKGLNEVISTVLIILLILIAVAILWFFVRPFIVDSGSTIDQSGSCLKTTIEPIKCQYTEGDAEHRNLLISLQRRGAGGNITSMKIILTNEAGQVKSFTEKDLLINAQIPTQDKIASGVIQILKSPQDFVPAKMQVAIQFISQNICPPYSAEIACKQYVYTKRCSDINQDAFANGLDYDLFTVLYARYIEGNGNLDPYYESSMGRTLSSDEIRNILDFNGDLIIEAQDYFDFQSAFEQGSDLC